MSKIQIFVLASSYITYSRGLQEIEADGAKLEKQLADKIIEGKGTYEYLYNNVMLMDQLTNTSTELYVISFFFFEVKEMLLKLFSCMFIH